MSLLSTLRSFAPALLFTVAAAAQVWIPTTFTTTRGSAYDRSIGNSWLGGGVHAHATLQTTRGVTYSQGFAEANARAQVNLLTRGVEVAELYAMARNRTEMGSQTRTGTFRMEVLGLTAFSQSFTSSGNLTRRTFNFNAFPVSPSASVPVGPFSVTVRGNVGANFSAYANLLLPTAAPSVSLSGEGRAYATATASVSVGIPGFSVGVGIQGRILDQTLALIGTAHATNGISGAATYSLTPISLRLYAFVDTFVHTWTTTLTSWSAAAVVRSLL
jgi:hypothetical protein